MNSTNTGSNGDTIGTSAADLPADTEAPGNAPLATPSKSPSEPAEGATAGRARLTLLVVGAGWLARFTPPGTQGVRPMGPPLEVAEEVSESGLGAGPPHVAVLSPEPRRERIVGRRLPHADLRALAARSHRLVCLGSDGEAVAAVIDAPEAPAAFMSDAGHPAAVADLAVRVGLAEDGWPLDATARLGILRTLLAAAGAHPDAPTRHARNFAYALALAADPGLPVPLDPEEVGAFARYAGVQGAAEGGGWPPALSRAELAELPDNPVIAALFRAAAEARRRHADPGDEEAGAEGDGTAPNDGTPAPRTSGVP